MFQNIITRNVTSILHPVFANHNACYSKNNPIMVALNELRCREYFDANDADFAFARQRQ